MNRTEVLPSYFPPTTPLINHFHFLGETDYDMDDIYYGTFDIGVAVGSDPDGGVVPHNLTLHYDNGTLVTVINNTFTNLNITHNGIYADIEFNSSLYYSDEWQYTLKIVATDDEGKSSSSWLGTNFTLSNTPIITDYSPETPITSVEFDVIQFDISINQIVNVTWFLDEIEVFNETDVITSSYNNNDSNINVRNVTVYVENINGTAHQEWEWRIVSSANFMPLPLFIACMVMLSICFAGGVPGMYKKERRIEAIIWLIMGSMISFMLTDISINGRLVSLFGYVSPSDTIIIGREIIQNSALHWTLLFISLMFLGMFLYIIFIFIQNHLKPVLEEEV